MLSVNGNLVLYNKNKLYRGYTLGQIVANEKSYRRRKPDISRFFAFISAIIKLIRTISTIIITAILATPK